MKKIPLILSAIAASALLALTAGAAPTVYEAADDNSFTVTYNGTAGEYYALVVVAGIADEGDAPAITESSILYIDQVTANASGVASFEDFLLKTDGAAGTVYLGGSDLSEAKLLGYVNKSDSFTVSGTVTSDSTKEASVTLTSTADSTKTFTVTTSSGSYTVSVPADTYKFVVTKKAHLSYTKNELVVSDDVEQNATLKGGDVNGDAKINIADLTNLLAAYNSTTQLDADINGDGKVAIADLTNLLKNYNSQATVE